MKSGKHIVVLTPGFPADEQDTNCIPPLQSYVFQLQRQYPEARISVISFQYPFVKKEYLWNNIRVFACGGRNRKFFSRLLTWWIVLRFFRQLYKIKPVTNLHGMWLTECTLLALVIGKFYGIPVLGTVLGQDAKKDNRYLRLLSYFSFKVVACSPFSAGIYRQSTGKEVDRIIPMGLGAEVFSVYDTEAGRNIDVIGVGNLGPVKNFSLFVEVIAEVKKEYPDIRCVIAGEGEERELLLQMISRFGLSENISLTGMLRRVEVLKLMNRSSVLLHTSAYEGQCYVFLEGLAMGMDVVSFKVGYMPEASVVHQCDNKTEMISKIKTLIRSGKKRLALPVISMEETVTQFSQLYN